jgi:hypothetical protein
LLTFTLIILSLAGCIMQAIAYNAMLT